MQLNFNKKILLPGAPLAVAMALMIVAIGCSSIKVIDRHESFTYANLQRGGLAIAAVTRPDTVDYYAERPVADLLSERLKAHWPRVRLLGLQEVHHLLGDAAHRQLRDAFREKGALPRNAFEKITPLAGAVRYVLLVDMRNEEMVQHQFVGERPILESWYNPRTKRYEAIQVGSEFIQQKGNSRGVQMAFVIYDLTTGEPAWIATGWARDGFANTQTDINRIPGVRDTGNVAVTDLLEEISGDLLRKLPRPK